MPLAVNSSRLMSHLEELSLFTRTPGEGVTRFSYSKEDMEAREFLYSLFNEAGLAVSVDGAGNIRGRLEGSRPDAPSVLSGSHIDTVLHGGMYDGAVGTLGALEAVQTIAESGCPRSHPLEIVVFSEEEGSNFGSTLAGSKVFVGRYGVADMQELKNPNGVSMYEMAKAAGYDPDSAASPKLRPESIKAMVELHIEQSVVLESKEAAVGLVEAIAGIKALEVRLKGVPNHAGATPMNLRQDPMVGAAHLIALIETLAKGSGTESTVATVGKIQCRPNVSNIIPGEVIFTVDIRDAIQSGIDSVLDGIAAVGPAIALARGLVLETIPISESAPVHLDGGILSLIERCAARLGMSYHRMNSGAVHDSCMLAPIVPTGMIFIPSKGGRSHVPEEYTSPEEIAKGTSLLAEVLLELAR